ncbi:MAG: hypothetical protein IPK83_16695 [Planctomycetes bacterium]|nr:hypothetical protein [Planctomycetota bacterium]
MSNDPSALMKHLEGLRRLYFAWCVVPLLRLVGPRVATAVARRLAAGVFGLNPPGRARGMQRIQNSIRERRLPSSKNDATSLLRESYCQYGRFWAESIYLAGRLTKTRWRRFVTCKSEDALQELACDRRGCLIAVAYHGNIAAAACALGHLFKPLYIVMDASMLPSRRVWQPIISKMTNLHIIERGAAGMEIPQVLENGGAVMMVVEHERVRGRGAPVQFMGRQFEAYPTIGRLSHWFDVPVAVMTCPRGKSAFWFELLLHEVIDPRAVSKIMGVSESERGDIGFEITRQTLAALEKGVLKSPEQYLWSVPTADDGARSFHSASVPIDVIAPPGLGRPAAQNRRADSLIVNRG